MMQEAVNDLIKLFKPKLINYVLGRRVCRQCSKIEWKDENKEQSYVQLLGICERCAKPGVVAYIEK